MIDGLARLEKRLVPRIKRSRTILDTGATVSLSTWIAASYNHHLRWLYDVEGETGIIILAAILGLPVNLLGRGAINMISDGLIKIASIPQMILDKRDARAAFLAARDEARDAIIIENAKAAMAGNGVSQEIIDKVVAELTDKKDCQGSE